MQAQNLRPNPKTGTMAVAVTTTAQSVAIPNGSGIVYAFQNRGAGDAFIEFQPNNTPTAVAPSAGNYGSTPVLANVPALPLIAPAGTTHIGLVASANCTVYITRGDAA